MPLKSRRWVKDTHGFAGNIGKLWMFFFFNYGVSMVFLWSLYGFYAVFMVHQAISGGLGDGVRHWFTHMDLYGIVYDYPQVIID